MRHHVFYIRRPMDVRYRLEHKAQFVQDMERIRYAFLHHLGSPVLFGDQGDIAGQLLDVGIRAQEHIDVIVASHPGVLFPLPELVSRQGKIIIELQMGISRRVLHYTADGPGVAVVVVEDDLTADWVLARIEFLCPAPGEDQGLGLA